MKNEKLIIGLTGPTGCGKTQASIFLERLGFVILNADLIVKNLYLTCDSLIDKINLKFRGVVENRIINKKKLADIVFKNKKELQTLENIVWPFVINQLNFFIEKSKRFNLLIDAPTLFESGAFKFCSYNIAVLSSKQNRLFRIMKRDSLTIQEATNRINAQPPDSFYINKADGLVLNDGLKIDLFRSLYFLIKKIKFEI